MMPSTSACSPASIVVATARRAGVFRQHHLDDMRREKRRLVVDERQALRSGFRSLGRGDELEARHPADDRSLACGCGRQFAIRVERGRPLRQACKERGLRHGELIGRCAEIAAAGALGPGHLIPVRRKVQIEREDVALRKPVLQPERDDGFVQLCAGAAPGTCIRAATGQQQLRDLLSDRRTSLDDRTLFQIPDGCAGNGDGIDAVMAEEAAVLCRERGANQVSAGRAPAVSVAPRVPSADLDS